MMHEFSIALNILEIAESTALQHEAPGISEVEVEVGDAAGVNIEALEFAWESAAGASPLLKQSKLAIHRIPLLFECPRCRHQYSPAELDVICPACGETDSLLVQGRELKVKSVTLMDP
jgi:hydrogenase nickel incorporation protein HypA/HybF